jgi:D-alanine-D-alanine ligase
MSQSSTQAPPARPDVVLVLWNQSHEGLPDSEPDADAEQEEDVGTDAGAEAEAAAGEAGLGPAHAETTAAAPGDEEEDAPAHDEGAREPGRMAQQAEAVSRALREYGMVATSVDIDDDIDRVIDSIVLERPIVIFNLVDQYDGDATQHTAVAGLLDLLGIPYTGSDPLALGSCQDRARTRLVLDDADVPVPGYAIVRDVNAIPDTRRLRPPLIVTQAFDDLYDEEGATRPIHDREELEARLYELAGEYELPLLVEEFLGGRRLHAVVTGSRVLDVLPLCETDDEGVVALSQLDSETADRARALARRAFRATGCRDLAQIDFHLQGGELAVTDVRPSLDLGSGSPFAVAASACEGGFDGVVAEIARQAIRRARAVEGAPGEEETPASGTEPAPSPAPEPAEENEAPAPTSAETS